MIRFYKVLLTTGVAGLFIIGCQSVDAPRNSETTLQPSLFVEVGRITLVDLNSATAVLRLLNSKQELPPLLYSRDLKNKLSSRMKVTGLVTGLSVGLSILEGTPVVGESVVMERIILEIPH